MPDSPDLFEQTVNNLAKAIFRQPAVDEETKNTYRDWNRMVATKTLPQDFGNIMNVVEDFPTFWKPLQAPAHLVTVLGKQVTQRMRQDGLDVNSTPEPTLDSFQSKYISGPSPRAAVEYAHHAANLLYHGFGKYLTEGEKAQLEDWLPYSTNKESEANPATHTLDRQFSEGIHNIFGRK